MEPTNGRRVVRALEVVTLTGRMPGAMTSYDARYPTTWLGVDRPDLAERIAVRVDRMWAAGLVDEVRALEARGLRDGVTASRALGYAQVLAHLDGTLTEDAAREATVVATRRFARRQRAWFRRDPRIRWLDPSGDLLTQALALI
jgi:tRNA dimethylallyltransferase